MKRSANHPRGRSRNGGFAREADRRPFIPWREDHDWRDRWAELRKEFIEQTGNNNGRN